MSAMIPRGKVSTYGAIGRALGMKSSARMVGWALNGIANSDYRHSSGKIMQVPAHRVVNRNGELTGKMHFATPTLMKELLLSEGIAFIGEAVDMERHLWEP